MHYSQMQKGKVYNLVYVGENEAYAKINGKRTIRVVNVSPIQYVELFDQFGDPLRDNIPSAVTTIRAPDHVFKNDQISEPADESEWFKHSMKVLSLDEAMENGVSLAQIRACGSGSLRDVPVFDRDMVLLGRYVQFNVEGQTNRPMLQTIFVCWSNYEIMRADFQRHGVTIRS